MARLEGLKASGRKYLNEGVRNSEMKNKESVKVTYCDPSSISMGQSLLTGFLCLSALKTNSKNSQVA